MYVFGSGWRGWRGGEWMRGLGLGFTNPVGTGGVLDVCVLWLRLCGRWSGALTMAWRGRGVMYMLVSTLSTHRKNRRLATTNVCTEVNNSIFFC